MLDCLFLAPGLDCGCPFAQGAALKARLKSEVSRAPAPAVPVSPGSLGVPPVQYGFGYGRYMSQAVMAPPPPGAFYPGVAVPGMSLPGARTTRHMARQEVGAMMSSAGPGGAYGSSVRPQSNTFPPTERHPKGKIANSGSTGLSRAAVASNVEGGL